MRATFLAVKISSKALFYQVYSIVDTTRIQTGRLSLSNIWTLTVRLLPLIAIETLQLLAKPLIEFLRTFIAFNFGAWEPSLLCKRPAPSNWLEARRNATGTTAVTNSSRLNPVDALRAISGIRMLDS